MAKRTNIDEILERKARQGPGGSAQWKILELTGTWSRVVAIRDVYNFIPMRLATIIEVYIRESVKEIVDTSPEYLDRAEALLRDVRFDFLTAKTLHGQRVTMGDIVAHSVSVNSLENIISIYEKLLPGYRNALPTVHERWIEDRDLPERSPIIKDIDRVLATVGRLLEVRHIVTHELPSSKPYSEQEINAHLALTDEFLKATDWYVIGALKGDIPRTQSTMNRTAGEALEAERAELQNVLEDLEIRQNTKIGLLNASQEAWAVYAKADSELQASIVEGGSMQPMVWASAMAELIHARTVSLRKCLEMLNSL